MNVGCGDIDGDGMDEIVTGAGPGAVFGPHVRGWNWDGSGAVQAIPGISFFAYEYTEWGANVACGDLDGDGFDEILTGPGPGPAHPPRIRGWNYDGTVLTAIGAGRLPEEFQGSSPVELAGLSNELFNLAHALQDDRHKADLLQPFLVAKILQRITQQRTVHMNGHTDDHDPIV